ncbi:hypothetical protein ACN38_g5651 [Penicillium nordicum]|uniref:Uncharacterized protein n=1 Tax=Penicillium nordicum TaxID=229535 RepID=A0A0M8P1U4_9EURO|nr:hypothetical protein ACN38_g5651 [Penicillium nordicum]
MARFISRSIAKSANPILKAGIELQPTRGRGRGSPISPDEHDGPYPGQDHGQGVTSGSPPELVELHRARGLSISLLAFFFQKLDLGPNPNFCLYIVLMYDVIVQKVYFSENSNFQEAEGGGGKVGAIGRTCLL